MIKEKEISLRVGSSNYKHYIENYGPFKKGDIISVKIEDLIENSVCKITTICDICGKEKIMKFQPYNNQIKKDGFYCCSKCKVIKTKKTNQEKYGVDYPMQSKEIIKKSKISLLKKYGIENISQRNDIREKRKERLSNSDYQNKMLNGVKLKYNIDNVSKLEFIKKKKEKTCLSNYGVINPSQSIFLFEKSQKNGKKIKYHEKTKLYYRGTYELDFLNFCFEKNIKIEKGPTISFKYKNKNKVYHSDYFLPDMNLICEIKSNYYYKKYLDLNLKKEEETLKIGYKFIFIIDKNYSFFDFI